MQFAADVLHLCSHKIVSSSIRRERTRLRKRRCLRSGHSTGLPFFSTKFAAKVFQALFIFTDISKFLLRAKNRGHFASHFLTTAVMQEMNVQMQLSLWSLSCPIKILKTGGGSGGRTLVSFWIR